MHAHKWLQILILAHLEILHSDQCLHPRSEIDKLPLESPETSAGYCCCNPVAGYGFVQPEGVEADASEGHDLFCHQVGCMPSGCCIARQTPPCDAGHVPFFEPAALSMAVICENRYPRKSGTSGHMGTGSDATAVQLTCDIEVTPMRAHEFRGPSIVQAVGLHPLACGGCDRSLAEDVTVSAESFASHPRMMHPSINAKLSGRTCGGALTVH